MIRPLRAIAGFGRKSEGQAVYSTLLEKRVRVLAMFFETVRMTEFAL
jgi:hypothetical protein